MNTMKLGKTGIDISRIGLGTWSIGGGSAWGGDHDLQVVVDTIREAPKAGSTVTFGAGGSITDASLTFTKIIDKVVTYDADGADITTVAA